MYVTTYNWIIWVSGHGRFSFLLLVRLAGVQSSKFIRGMVLTEADASRYNKDGLCFFSSLLHVYTQHTVRAITKIRSPVILLDADWFL